MNSYCAAIVTSERKFAEKDLEAFKIVKLFSENFSSYIMTVKKTRGNAFHLQLVMGVVTSKAILRLRSN